MERISEQTSFTFYLFLQRNMSTVPSLKILALGKFMPEDLVDLQNVFHAAKIDMETPITQILRSYDTSIAQMVDLNLDYGGWWGLPGDVSRFTYDHY